MACVTYLLFDAFETGVCKTDEEFEARLRSNVLYSYAARNWGHYVKEILTEAASAKVEQMVMDFLESRAKVSSSTQAIIASKFYVGTGYGQRVPLQVAGMHVVAYFGLEKVITTLLEKDYDPDPIDSYDGTPLPWTAENGHEGAVKLLLDIDGVDPDSKDRFGRTPLLLAARSGHEGVVKLLKS
jgi:ankyrin repeat protein